MRPPTGTFCILSNNVLKIFTEHIICVGNVKSPIKIKARCVSTTHNVYSILHSEGAPGRAPLLCSTCKPPAFIHFDHGGEVRKFQRARLQSSSEAPSVKRFSVVQRCVLGDFCMVICCGGGGTREACFSKERFEAWQKYTWTHGEIRIYTSNCSVPGRDETLNKFFSFDLQV